MTPPQNEAAAPTSSRSSDRRRALVEGVTAALIVYVIAGGSEEALIRILRPTEGELTWISDVVTAAAFGVAVYLWRHLRATRLELSERERDELVLQAQLTLAASMQRRLLPAAPPPDHGFEWAAVQIPAGRIGGDFYDFVEQSPGVWMVLTADVSGKGVPAAMALGLLRSIFRTIAREIVSPGLLVGRLSSALFEEWSGDPYLTCIVARVDTHERKLTSTNAGHPPGIVLRESTCKLLQAGGPPAGLIPGAAYGEDVIELRTGDRCVFVTDGVTEALDTGSEPSISIVASTASAHFPSSRAMCDAIMNRSMLGGGPSGIEAWSDDRTVVAFVVSDR